MVRSKKKTEDISLTFFLQVMNHWATPGAAAAVVALSLFLLCSGASALMLLVGGP